MAAALLGFQNHLDGIGHGVNIRRNIHTHLPQLEEDLCDLRHAQAQCQQLGRTGEHVLHGVVHGNLLVAHHQHTVRVLGNILHAVGDQQHGGAGLFVVLLDLRQDLVPDRKSVV